MAVTLSKGGNMSLSKTDPALQRVMVGLGWEARSTTGAEAPRAACPDERRTHG